MERQGELGLAAARNKDWLVRAGPRGPASMTFRVLTSLPAAIHPPLIDLPHDNQGGQYRHRSDSILPQSTTYSVEAPYRPPEKVKIPWNALPGLHSPSSLSPCPTGSICHSWDTMFAPVCWQLCVLFPLRGITPPPPSLSRRATEPGLHALILTEFHAPWVGRAWGFKNSPAPWR